MQLCTTSSWALRSVKNQAAVLARQVHLGQALSINGQVNVGKVVLSGKVYTAKMDTKQVYVV
jgi:hypothetical protein